KGIRRDVVRSAAVSGRLGRDIIHRCPGNPLVTINSLTSQASDIYDAGAVRLDGEYVLLITVQSLEGHCSMYLARSTDGRHFNIEGKPFMSRARSGPFAEGESLGIRDARITRLDDTWYICYLAEGDAGERGVIARTDDFTAFERIAFLNEPDTKNPALFPAKIDGRYALLERPPTGAIWIAYSDDLVYWGSRSVVMSPRGGYWDSDRVGAAAPPIEIDGGWLLIYYGVRSTGAGPLFRLGAAILDRNDPSQVVARSNVPILSPREKYERVGDVGNLVFATGALLEPTGDVLVYYGASDSCICLGIASLDEIIQACMASVREY
ncbi:MAG TPA: glycoside hydrolase family 130 protein, partial [Planctomycetota bacterium]|nr:glycoside hydrolase family 130 protein [Planctomycetota bacterium]